MSINLRDGIANTDPPCIACGSWFVVSRMSGKPSHPMLSITPAKDTMVKHRCQECLHYWESPFWEKLPSCFIEK